MVNYFKGGLPMSEKGCFVNILKKDKEKDYSDIHLNAWPEVLKEIKESGITKEVIYIYKNLAIIYMEAESIDKAYSKLMEKDIFKKWLKVNDQFVESHPDFEGENIANLKKVFDLEEQLKK